MVWPLDPALGSGAWLGVCSGVRLRAALPRTFLLGNGHVDLKKHLNRCLIGGAYCSTEGAW